MNDQNPKYSWVETFKQIVMFLKNKKNKQKQLIQLLKDIGVTGFNDTDENNKKIELDEIDPFTFFFYINKYGKKRIGMFQKLSKKLKLQSYPTDDLGIPSVFPKNVWLFPIKADRNNNEINKLWDLFKKAINDNIDEKIFAEVLEIKNTAKVKLTEALFLINPEKYFPIDGPTIEYLNNNFNIDTNFETFSEYKSILQKIKSKISKKFYEISYEAWKWNDSKKHSAKKYWIYAPGKNASEWEEFKSLKIMGLGWEELGNFNDYSSKDDIVKKLQSINSNNKKYTNDSAACWDFKSSIGIGDIIIAKNGNSELLGYGVVESSYYYDQNRKKFKSCRKVNWIKTGSWQSDGNLPQKTLTEVRKTNEIEKYIDIFQIPDQIVIIKPTPELPSLNIILYGPPGTGKTFKLKNEYFKMFTDENSGSFQNDISLSEALSEYSWWEIIAAVVYDLKTKKLPTKLKDIYNHPLIKELKKIKNSNSVDHNIRGFLYRHTHKSCQYVQIDDNLRQKPSIFIQDKDKNWSLIDENKIKKELTIKELLDLFTNYQKAPKQRYIFTTFHQSYSYEEFIEGIKPVIVDDVSSENENKLVYEIKPGVFKQIVNEALEDRDNKYAIFIDEINRGNIANIFGELITIIEEDKRISKDNYIPVKLPYSREEFGIPDNLYIIGTMNTADRSVEAIDTALRRRFSFIQMNPDSAILDKDEYRCEGIELKKLLESINNRIEKLLNQDHCIGHSYFMTIENRNAPLEELKIIFADKILPLLQEYFYGDWGKIRLILGDGFVEKKNNSANFLCTNDYDGYEEFDEKPIYSFTDKSKWELKTFTRIYE